MEDDSRKIEISAYICNAIIPSEGMNNSLSLSINVDGQLLDLSQPKVMGILNVTPDSFYAGCRQSTELDIATRAATILNEGATIIDLGAYSSRQTAQHISSEEEMSRLKVALSIINKNHPDAIVSVDTFRADVAKMCVEEFGVSMINDISAGTLDDNMFTTISKLNVPYIIMHMRGTPQTMQQDLHYKNFLPEVLFYFSEKIKQLRDLGLNDIIIDPGFGFAKSIDHNYELMHYLDDFRIYELPILVGVSRKSMIYKYLDITPEEALNGTTVLHTISLLKGAHILRVHDVKEAVESVKLVQKIKETASIY